MLLQLDKPWASSTMKDHVYVGLWAQRPTSIMNSDVQGKDGRSTFCKGTILPTLVMKFPTSEVPNPCHVQPLPVIGFADPGTYCRALNS